MMGHYEDMIIAMNSRVDAYSNDITMRYYALLGVYKYLGGKENIAKRIVDKHVIDRLTTKKAMKTYIWYALNYAEITIVYLKLKSKYTKKNKDITLLYDTVTDLIKNLYPNYKLDYMQFDNDISEAVKGILIDIAKSLYTINIDRSYFNIVDETL